MVQTIGGILAAAAIIAALTVIGKCIAWLVVLLRKVGRFVDDLTGEPERDGFPARPGVLARLKSIEDITATLATLAALAALELRLAALEEQMHPNGGTSLRDAADRIEAAITAKPETTEAR